MWKKSKLPDISHFFFFAFINSSNRSFIVFVTRKILTHGGSRKCAQSQEMLRSVSDIYFANAAFAARTSFWAYSYVDASSNSHHSLIRFRSLGIISKRNTLINALNTKFQSADLLNTLAFRSAGFVSWIFCRRK